jgi:predicted AAA+ superfamily ATPase
MIKRQISDKCLKLAKQYPVLSITGPRQSGKTTLAKALFNNKEYVNFEDPDIRAQALEDPRGFLGNYPRGAVFDEIQRVPQMLSYIQSIVDRSGKKGLFILTGSQQFEVSRAVTQSLAGRTALIKLLPLSMEELRTARPSYVRNLEKMILKGFYPRIYREKMDPTSYYMNYFETYVQRDLRQISQIEDLHHFEKFVRLLASRVGQILSYSGIANDLGVSQPTVKKWISILEASFIIYLHKPYFANIGKRLIKSPKIYFIDTGLLVYLLGISNEKELKQHHLRGGIFENLIIAEFLKNRYNLALTPNLYFLRDKYNGLKNLDR